VLSKQVVILISGKAGTGKTTTAKYLVKHLGKAGIFPFADPLKAIARRMSWDGNKTEAGRRLLQGLGTLGREYNPFIWIKLSMDDALYSAQDLDLDYIIVDDWRFPNEYEYVKSNPGVQVFTVRMFAPNREILKGTPEYNDISETSLQEDDLAYDIWLDNTGDISELYIKLDSVVKFILDHVQKWEKGE
jgi:hypothetical protein